MKGKKGVGRLIVVGDHQCVFQVDRKRGTLTLTELAPGVAVDEVRRKTEARFDVAEVVEMME